METRLSDRLDVRSDGTTGLKVGRQTIRSNGEVETTLGGVTISSRGTISFDF